MTKNELEILVLKLKAEATACSNYTFHMQYILNKRN